MSKPISVARLKENIKDRPESIALLKRTLPIEISREIARGSNEKIIKGLQKRLNMVMGL
tara:strand:+ start:57 stop:233 length:177 start_codon:yes stop_codon:yes gene_type:complete